MQDKDNKDNKDTPLLHSFKVAHRLFPNKPAEEVIDSWKNLFYWAKDRSLEKNKLIVAANEKVCSIENKLWQIEEENSDLKKIIEFEGRLPIVISSMELKAIHDALRVLQTFYTKDGSEKFLKSVESFKISIEHEQDRLYKKERAAKKRPHKN